MGDHSNQDPRWTQKPIYAPIFTHHIRSWLLRASVIVLPRGSLNNQSTCSLWGERFGPRLDVMMWWGVRFLWWTDRRSFCFEWLWNPYSYVNPNLNQEWCSVGRLGKTLKSQHLLGKLLGHNSLVSIYVTTLLSLYGHKCGKLSDIYKSVYHVENSTAWGNSDKNSRRSVYLTTHPEVGPLHIKKSDLSIKKNPGIVRWGNSDKNSRPSVYLTTHPEVGPLHKKKIRE